jgi:uncharacterized membrane protein YkvA (DUF1232 family)
MNKNYESYSKHYSESGFWIKMRKIVANAGAKTLYCALLLFYTMTDKNVPIEKKTMIAGALGYLIFPLDVVPDFIPIAGLSDDLAAMIVVINLVKSCITPEINKKAKAKLKEMIGDFNENELLEIV